jgi:hypothetical protein
MLASKYKRSESAADEISVPPKQEFSVDLNREVPFEGRVGSVLNFIVSSWLNNYT